MLLVIDVGNTNTVFGIYKDNDFVDSWRMTTERNRTADETGMFIKQIFTSSGFDTASISDVIISSVVPPVMYSVLHCIRKYFDKEPLIVDSTLDLGIQIKTDNPSEVGADRLVNAVAAYTLYGGPVIIVDFGTATTICAVSGKGEYLGGAICPGVKISVEALYQNTAKLPRIELNLPHRVIGPNTVHAMQAGVVFGYKGQILYILDMMKKEMNAPMAKTVATGGLARMITQQGEIVDVINSRLTLEGLNIIYHQMLSKRQSEKGR